MKKVIWKQKSSRLDGYENSLHSYYQRKIYRIDYSLAKKRVRLFLEDAGGKRFWSEIQSGKKFRNNLGRVTSDNSDQLHRERDIFSTIPEPAVLQLINGHHGIDRIFRGISLTQSSTPDNSIKSSSVVSALDKEQLKETKEKYFHSYRHRKKTPKFSFLSNFLPSFSFNTGILRHLFETGFFIAIAFLGWRYHILSVISIGAILAFAGVILGGVDFFIREEDPFLPKVVTLLVSGSYIYLNNYF